MVSSPVLKIAGSFASDAIACAAELYLPQNFLGKIPCVVMANGFSGTMDWILPDFAERFAQAGMGVLAFDYRHLGKSEGEPRQIISVKKQREDLLRAVEFARNHPDIDPERIALWGTSLGGSHALETAAVDARIAALVLNMPALDAYQGGANLREKMQRAHIGWAGLLGSTIQLLGAAFFDSFKGALGLSPHYVAVYGDPGKAFFTDPELAERFAKVDAESPTWENRVAPRFLLAAPRYRAGTMERIRAPILICLASGDIEVSAEFIKDKAKQARNATIKEYPATHFEMYHGAMFERVVADQLEFLSRSLL